MIRARPAGIVPGRRRFVLDEDRQDRAVSERRAPGVNESPQRWRAAVVARATAAATGPNTSGFQDRQGPRFRRSSRRAGGAAGSRIARACSMRLVAGVLSLALFAPFAHAEDTAT